MRNELLNTMKLHDFPLRYKTVMLDRPLCYEADSLLKLPLLKYKTYSDLLSKKLPTYVK